MDICVEVLPESEAMDKKNIQLYHYCNQHYLFQEGQAHGLTLQHLLPSEKTRLTEAGIFWGRVDGGGAGETEFLPTRGLQHADALSDTRSDWQPACLTAGM